MVTAQALLDEARKYIGITKGSMAHHKLVDDYNGVSPLPAGYQVKYSDEWCDVFVTVIGDKLKASHLIGRECGVQRHIEIFQLLGIWKGRDFPKAGDIVTFDWDGNGWADHIGFVESVQDNRITTIEGNSHGRVQRNTFVWNDRRIKGYARPRYLIASEIKKTIEEVANEVIAGKWSTGQERLTQLSAAGYDATAVQNQVNELMAKSVDKSVDREFSDDLTLNVATLPLKYLNKIMKLAKSYRILPSLLIVMLHLEGLWGHSNVAKLDNNWAGMTWSDTYIGNSYIEKSKGSARLASEGGHYIRYQSVEDFFEDWVYLLRPHGIYKVTEKWLLAEAVKGLFKSGGAKYDYASVGYPTYLESMLARKLSIDQANPGRLNALDQEVIAEFGQANELKASGKVQVASDATHWQTGEKMATWVKGLAFDVLETKEVTQHAYLLGSQGIPIGWILASDVD